MMDPKTNLPVYICSFFLVLPVVAIQGYFSVNLLISNTSGIIWEEAAAVQMATFVVCILFTILFLFYSQHDDESRYPIVILIIFISAGVLCLIGCLHYVYVSHTNTDFVIYAMLFDGFYIILQCCLFYVYCRGRYKEQLRGLCPQRVAVTSSNRVMLQDNNVNVIGEVKKNVILYFEDNLLSSNKEIQSQAHISHV